MARSLIQWNPFGERFPSLQSVLPRELLGWPSEAGLEMEWRPRSDITDGESEMIVHAELPGVSDEDIDVQVSDGVLRIRGEKKAETSGESDGRTYSERFFGSFERSIPLPAEADMSGITAELADGVLTVRVPKAKREAPEPHRIEVSKKSAQ